MRVSERHAWRLLAAEGSSTATSPETPGAQGVRRSSDRAGRAGGRRSRVRRVRWRSDGRARKAICAGSATPRRGCWQVDGSRHDWLEGRGPRLTLIGAVDDATGTVPFALFREQEDAHGYLLMLGSLPMALYNRHSIFQRSPRRRAGEASGPARAHAVGSEHQLIMAHTPQAKGRWSAVGHLPGPLVSEMRLAGAATIEEANRMLGDFLPRYDRQFAVAPAQREPAYRPLPPGVSLDAVLCFKYLRTVANDHTVHFNGQTLQLLPDGHRAGYARTRVTRAAGRQHRGRPPGQDLATAPAPAGLALSPHGPALQRSAAGRLARPAPVTAHRQPPRPPAKTPARTPNKPAPNHWRRGY